MHPTAAVTEEPATTATRAWLRAAAGGSSEVDAVRAAAEAVAGDPWVVVEAAGPLARARMARAAADMGIGPGLEVLSVDSPRAAARVPAGAPYPEIHRDKMRRLGGFDTPRAMAREAVDLALSAGGSMPWSALDPCCGTGAFLVALAERGIFEVRGEDIDALVLEVARVALPRARLALRDVMEEGPPAELVVGNPPFVAPENQDKELRARLTRENSWLHGRFDLAVPAAWAMIRRLAPGGGACLVLPAALMLQPYGRALREGWLRRHLLTHVGEPEAFPAVAARVVLLALQAGGGPGPVAPHGTPAEDLLSLPGAPITSAVRPGDVDILRHVRRESVTLGELAEVDTGVVCHGPGHRRGDLVSDEPGPGLLPYVEARDLKEGRVRWLDYRPDDMHRPKRPALFGGPKLLVARVGRGPVMAWVDREGLYAGHTLTVVRPTCDMIPVERLHHLLTHELVGGLLQLEGGDRLDLYPRAVRRLPVPRAWLDSPDRDLQDAWRLSRRAAARLRELARQGGRAGASG